MKKLNGWDKDTTIDDLVNSVNDCIDEIERLKKDVVILNRDADKAEKENEKLRKVVRLLAIYMPIGKDKEFLNRFDSLLND